MQRIKKETLSQQLTARIIAYIESEQLKPGDRLPPEKEIVAKFRVSRTVARESLKSLETLGVIRFQPGHGIYVDQPSMKDITHHISFQWKRDPETLRDLLDLRIILETAAIERIIQHHDPERIAAMKHWNERMEARIHEDIHPGEEDFQFHRALIEAAGNNMLLQMSEILRSFFSDIQKATKPSNKQLWKLSAKEHWDIIHWIEKEHVENAQLSMRQHLKQLEHGAAFQ